MFIYQNKKQYFAQLADGLDELGSRELASFRARQIRSGYRGIYFEAEQADLFRINYGSRLISRILAPLAGFKCHSTRYLHAKAKEIPWKELFSTGQTFGIFATVSNSRVRHSKYAALCLKDAIADYFREITGKRPDVDPRNPDVWINLHIDNNHAVISLDTSGGPLHKRGYRKESVNAPMQETLASAIIELSGWDGSRPLYDPMCGSGTLLCEALMRYCRIPAGYIRSRFGFERLPDFDPEIWKKIKSEMDGNIQKLQQGLIAGNDHDSRAVKATRVNLNQFMGGSGIQINNTDFQKLDSLENSIIVTNPPYGIRMKDDKHLEIFYQSLGDFLKQKCTGSEAYIYFGDRKWIKCIGLRSTWKMPLKNGGLDGRLVKYELY